MMFQISEPVVSNLWSDNFSDVNEALKYDIIILSDISLIPEVDQFQECEIHPEIYSLKVNTTVETENELKEPHAENLAGNIVIYNCSIYSNW